MTAMREMVFWPPYAEPNERAYTLKHVRILEKTLSVCRSFRTAVQAGGSIGYWPRRMADKFARVITFEPEPMIRDCLVRNLAGNGRVTVRSEALGAEPGRCSIERRGFGSHIVVAGDGVDIATIDSLALDDLDLLQLDIEGYEAQALSGGVETIRRCRPVIQVEILEGDEVKSAKARIIREMMVVLNYREALSMGRDYVFVSA